MSRIGKVVATVTLAVSAGLLGLGALVFVQPAAANNAVQDVVANVAANVTGSYTEHGGPGGGGFCGVAGLEAAATALNTTATDLEAKLRSGQTLEELATAANVDIADVQAAIQAACTQANKDAIEAAVTAGTLTREKADWLLEGLDKGYWGTPDSGPGFGFGPGFGGGHGRGGFGPHGPRDGAPDSAAPTATPSADI